MSQNRYQSLSSSLPDCFLKLQLKSVSWKKIVSLQAVNATALTKLYECSLNLFVFFESGDICVDRRLRKYITSRLQGVRADCSHQFRPSVLAEKKPSWRSELICGGKYPLLNKQIFYYVDLDFILNVYFNTVLSPFFFCYAVSSRFWNTTIINFNQLQIKKL